MTDDESKGGNPTQSMTLRGNVFVQGDTQSNTSQVVVLYNDGGASGLTLNVKALYNTFVGPSTNNRAAFIHLYDESGATTMNAELANNIIYRTSRPTLVENSRGHVTGANNWLQTGADASGLTGSITGSDPKFANAAQNGFTLATGSPAIGAALTSVSGLPDREYYRDETTTRQYRARAGAADLGAFESTTTAAPIGPYGTPLPTGAGGTSGAAGSAGTAGASGRGGAGRGGTTGSAGVAGAMGAGGATGAAGDAGPAGANGTAGTPGAAGTTASGVGGSTPAPTSGSGCHYAGTDPGVLGGLGVLGALGIPALARRRRDYSSMIR